MASLHRFLERFSRKPEPGPAAPLLGFVEELSVHHVAGWAQSAADMSQRVALTVRRRDTGKIMAQNVADHFRWGLTQFGANDEGHGFFIRFAQPLPSEVLPHIEVEATRDHEPLQRAPYLTDRYEPMMAISGDIVNNCNLRCPFCLFDYSKTRNTYLMDERTIDAALRFLPYVTDGNFWYSCRHEPTLHPELMRYIDKVPRTQRKKIFYTTNLAKRMPETYFDWLADAGLHHVNVSIESRVPAVYEKMRKGARFPIFMENWNLLVEAQRAHAAPTPVRYIAMVYQSNYRELPELVTYLLEERNAASVELRYTFDYDYIPADFRESEFLDAQGWLWLRDQLAGYPADKVLLILPPDIALEHAPLEIELKNRSGLQDHAGHASGIRHYLPGRYEARLSWDGTCEIRRYWAHPYERPPVKEPLCTVNVNEIADPLTFFRDLPE
jgi:MoaA/NifB/PqqE/SkfB family radical SAM enzyme